MGVAVVLAVDLANTSARRGFELAMNRITGHATPHPRRTAGVAETVLHRFAGRHGIQKPAAPVVTGYLPSADRPGRLLQILGIDPFAESTLSRFRGRPHRRRFRFTCLAAESERRYVTGGTGFRKSR
ncbi:MAG: hypothetical protein R3F36_13125 [Candidatus Competibacteraceae bacterium]